MKRGGKKKVVPRAVQKAQQAPKLNPFELKRTRKKFDVLGKRDNKGDNRNIIQAREDANNKRKKTLLVEYKQLRKANTFIDRRFGEDDPLLDEEDRALARFQVQRMRDARKGSSKFALAGDDADGSGGAAGGGGRGGWTLTHGGVSLEELEELNSRPSEALADLDDDVLEELVERFHFGGGGGGLEQQQQHGGAAGGGDAPRRMSKREIMEEIIAKSKAAKAERARQKEADEAALAALDGAFRELVDPGSGAGLAALIKPPGYDKGRKVKPDNDADADYDRAARELAFEAKGQAGERTLTQEELEEKESARLAALEAARLKRMRADAADAAGGDADGGDDGEQQPLDGEQQQLPAGGYAAKRARARAEAERDERRQRRRLDASGDALEENCQLGSSDDGEGGDDGGSEGGGAAANQLEARRQEAAAGDHPLQQAFRQAAASLAAKYGVPGAAAADASGSDEDASEGAPSSDEDGEEGEGGSSSGGSQDEQEDGAGLSGSSGSEEEESDGSGSGSDEEEGAELPHPTKLAKQQQQQQQQPDAAAAGRAQQRGAAAAAAAAAAGDDADGPLDLSFTPPVPRSYAEFAALVGGRPAHHLGLAIQRIRAFNAAGLVADNKRQLQVFYGILVQHFAMLAGETPLPAAHLDELTRVLLQLTPEVPYYAATVARTRLDHLHARLAAALADPLAAGPLLGWPGPRGIAQLRLFGLLFPTSDRRHAVTTPLALLLGKYLGQLPVASTHQAGLGLLLAGLALHHAAPAERFCPEAVNFVAASLAAIVPAAAAASGGQQAANSISSSKGRQPAAAGAPLPVVSRFTPGLLAFSSPGAGKQQQAARGKKRQQHAAADEQEQQQLPQLNLHQLLSAAPNAPELGSDAFKLQLLGCAVATARRVLQLSGGCGDAAPEVLQPLLAAAQAVGRQQGALPEHAAAAVSGLARELQRGIGDAVAARTPLVQSHRVKVVLPREFNPRFEADFHAAADYDPDRSRSEARKLARALAKEKRGAMRELRRDAAFMAAERDSEKAKVDAERLASERAFYSELQRQEADAKSGGQGGMHPHRKKRGRG